MVPTSILQNNISTSFEFGSTAQAQAPPPPMCWRSPFHFVFILFALSFSSFWCTPLSLSLSHASWEASLQSCSVLFVFVSPNSTIMIETTYFLDLVRNMNYVKNHVDLIPLNIYQNTFILKKKMDSIYPMRATHVLRKKVFNSIKSLFASDQHALSFMELIISGL